MRNKGDDQTADEQVHFAAVAHITGRSSSINSIFASYANRPEIQPRVHPCGGFFSSSTDSRGQVNQLMAKDWALNTGKLHVGGSPRNSVVKLLIVPP